MDYFVEQQSPLSKRRGIAPLTGILGVDITPGLGINNSIYLHTGIEVDGKTCCPCSREISDFDEKTGRGKGAHAQRSHVRINLDHMHRTMIWWESLLGIAQAAFSSPVYPVLKRVDERAVTMAAYSNPKFVEDVIRDVVLGLGKAPFARDVILWRVRVDNAESIHYHDAFAETSGTDFTDVQA